MLNGRLTHNIAKTARSFEVSFRAEDLLRECEAVTQSKNSYLNNQ